MNKYILVTKEMTLQDAQEYCRQTYGDLATVDNKDDLNQLQDLTGGVDTWIGLHDFNRESMDLYPNSWRWSTQTRSQTGYMNFASGPSSAKTYHLVTQTVSWESAKSYCRTHYTDLAKIENQAENQQVSSLVTTYSWIGLSRVPWAWSDGSNGSFRDWGAGEPNNYRNTDFCTIIRRGAIWDIGCQHTMGFICMDGCFSGQHRKQGLQPELERSADKTRAGRREP
ncbi:hypothetical protein NHX12_013784 [Muraenolepis orangiensis]|uniref:C-type lectin domain-containing protein n=1 Tax=Muraenolepis orangiensis TaxID=630683 RepID=A0A9Q0DE87_9TELE|nr:hypothetical protein NHX12_013784 [Muraenolepis orangiensis]